LSLLPDFFIDTDASIDWQKASFSEFPIGQLEYREILLEAPVEEPVEDAPEASNEDSSATPLPEEHLPVVITELLPNALGSDTGKEFIEIYNPNEQVSISLNGYKLAVGPTLGKVITLSEYILKPGEYKVFTNAELGYSLLNTSSRVTLYMPNGDIASEVPVYDSPRDGKSWALIDKVWQYTDQPTPGTVNIRNLFQDNEVKTENSTALTLKACADNQYRSPQTNRCRLISSNASASPAPCKVGQKRNFETGRCKAITPTATTACKKGQEKNLETNRCRNIKQLSTATYGVKGATNKQQGGMGWYMWAVIAGIVLLIVGYGAWEWRDELKKLIETLRAKFAGKAK
jgi:hypothetical protein